MAVVIKRTQSSRVFQAERSETATPGNLSPLHDAAAYTETARSDALAQSGVRVSDLGPVND
jgi:hypothetical protein